MNSEKIPRHHRQENEVRTTEYFPVTFSHDTDTYEAQLTNLSMKGAHLLVKSYEPVRHILDIGAELNLYVRTPYGKSHCMAKVVWLDPKTSPVSIGLEFTSMSEDASDPLRCAIDSPL
jgi:hypothetical protein